MSKKIIVTEKPSVAREFAKVLGVSGPKNDGFIENNEWIITWCVGHLVTLDDPESYDEELKHWRLDTLPIIPSHYKYHVIKDVAHQFGIVKKIYNRKDVDTIYYAGDPAREGIYIQMLVRMQAGLNPNITERVVWIDSQTEDEIKRGIREAKPLSEYQKLADSGYMRAIEDWLLGMNFSRALSIRYSSIVSTNRRPIAVGRVMSCVLGMIVERELEIRNFVPVPFFKIQSCVKKDGMDLVAGWKCVPGSSVYNSPLLYDASGFKTQEDAEKFIATLPTDEVLIKDITKTEKKKYAPMLFSLAELQTECARVLHLTPQQTLDIAQSLYEKKMTTYPRTDARVLSSAVAKEIGRNLSGLRAINALVPIIDSIKNPASIANTKYTDDSKVTDHYAIIPTGQGVGQLGGLSDAEKNVYQLIVKRFLSIFMPPAIYEETKITEQAGTEIFTVSGSVLVDPGYMVVTGVPNGNGGLPEAWKDVKKGDRLGPVTYGIVRGETTPPKRYTEGSIIAAMENAGQLIEDEELRAQIKGSGIGTSATRATTIEKLKKNYFIQSEKKTLVLTPTNLGFRNYEVIKLTVPDLLNPKMTANWEKGLDAIVSGETTRAEYQTLLDKYITNTVASIKNSDIGEQLRHALEAYPESEKEAKATASKSGVQKVSAEAYLTVPFDDKDQVKALGARWDAERKSWYVPKGKDTAPFKKWLADKTPPKASSVKKVYIKVPFDDKDAAKQAGARWDPDKKSWYYMSNMDANAFAKWK